MSEQGCPKCSIQNAEYLGNEEDGTPVYKCKACGKVFLGGKEEKHGL